MHNEEFNREFLCSAYVNNHWRLQWTFYEQTSLRNNAEQSLSYLREEITSNSVSAKKELSDIKDSAVFLSCL